VPMEHIAKANQEEREKERRKQIKRAQDRRRREAAKLIVWRGGRDESDPSAGSYYESKDQRFSISPIFGGRVYPIGYELRDNGGPDSDPSLPRKVGGVDRGVRWCKLEAEDRVRDERARVALAKEWGWEVLREKIVAELPPIREGEDQRLKDLRKLLSR